GDDDDPVALGRAMGQELTSDPLGRSEHLGVGPGQPLFRHVEPDGVGPLGGLVAQHGRQRPLGAIGERGLQVAVVAEGHWSRPSSELRRSPRKSGLRFSRNARAPSRMSSLPMAWISEPRLADMLSFDWFHHWLLLVLAISR